MGTDQCSVESQGQEGTQVWPLIPFLPAVSPTDLSMLEILGLYLKKKKKTYTLLSFLFIMKMVDSERGSRGLASAR